MNCPVYPPEVYVGMPAVEPKDYRAAAKIIYPNQATNGMEAMWARQLVQNAFTGFEAYPEGQMVGLASRIKLAQAMWSTEVKNEVAIIAYCWPQNDWPPAKTLIHLISLMPYGNPVGTLPDLLAVEWDKAYDKLMNPPAPPSFPIAPEY